MKTPTANFTSLFKAIPLIVFLFSAAAAFSQTTELASNYDSINSLLEPAPMKTAVAVFTSKTNELSLQEYIAGNLEFPAEGRAKGIYGTVTVRFEILTDGNIGTIVILDSPGPSFDASVKKFLNEMPLWTPAYQNSVAVTSVHQLDLNFRLQ